MEDRMVINWECPRCDAVYPDTSWTIGGSLNKPSLVRRMAARIHRKRAITFYTLWHSCPHGHHFPNGAPYGLVPGCGRTRALTPNGFLITLPTMPA